MRAPATHKKRNTKNTRKRGYFWRHRRKTANHHPIEQPAKTATTTRTPSGRQGLRRKNRNTNKAMTQRLEAQRPAAATVAAVNLKIHTSTSSAGGHATAQHPLLATRSNQGCGAPPQGRRSQEKHGRKREVHAQFELEIANRLCNPIKQGSTVRGTCVLFFIFAVSHPHF